MPRVSVVMPVYNVEQFVAAAIESVLAQTFTDFELIIVNDQSPDSSLEICESYDDSRIRIITHTVNRGLAGARNTGIRESSGDFVALLDSDDMWEPTKLEQHVEHLSNRPDVGVSFSRSAFIDEDGNRLNAYQMPKLTNITADHLLCRNPVGNGSAPVIRRQILTEIEFMDSRHGEPEPFYFDEDFRQSEDIECWIRTAATTHCTIEGISEPLTLYRLNSGGLSANIPKQLASWDAVMTKTRGYAPELVKRSGKLARAYQLRYLARQAIRLQDGKLALDYTFRALKENPSILFREPTRTVVTLIAALMQRLIPAGLYNALEPMCIQLIGVSQKMRIAAKS